jgi:hypothetical protein
VAAYFYLGRTADKQIAFTDHFKTSQPGSNQNRPLPVALCISGFLMLTRGFSITSYLPNLSAAPAMTLD